MQRWQCDVCGYIAEGKIPAICPKCKAGAECFFPVETPALVDDPPEEVFDLDSNAT